MSETELLLHNIAYALDHAQGGSDELEAFVEEFCRLLKDHDHAAFLLALNQRAEVGMPPFEYQKPYMEMKMKMKMNKNWRLSFAGQTLWFATERKALDFVNTHLTADTDWEITEGRMVVGDEEKGGE